jgi:acyl-CoA thioesterase FadM
MASSWKSPGYHYRNAMPPLEANSMAKVDFSHYFALMGKCCNVALEEMLPNADAYKRQGFGLLTEYAQIEFARPAKAMDQVLVRMSCLSRTRTRMEFEFEFISEPDEILLGKGRNVVVWVNPQHNPAVMPEELYNHAALQPVATAAGADQDDG